MCTSWRLVCLALPCLLWLAGPVVAQGNNEVDLVRSFYRKYLNREPARWEMTSWVRALQRGDSPTRLQGLFMASDEFFRLQGNNPEAWLVAVYQEFVGRNPSRGEVRDLLGRFGAGTREQRERLVAAVQSGPALQPPPPVPRPPTQAPELAGRLVSLSQQFVDMVRLDLAGSRQGRQLLIRGKNLLAVSERFRQSFAANITAEQRQQAFADVEQAFQAVQAELANPPGTTPNAAPVAQAIGQVLDAMRLIAGVPPPQPPVVIPEGLTPEQREQALRLSAELTRENQRLIEYARQVRPRNPAFCDSLLRHAEALAGQLSEFTVRLTRGVSLGALQRAFQPIRNQAGAMRELVRAGCPFVTVEQRVWSLQQKLRLLAEVLGLGPDLGIDPDRPVVIDPSFPNVPLPPPPPPPLPAPNQKVVIACDGALSLIDSAVTHLGPAAAQSATIARMLVHTRQLRADIARLRQRAALGAGAAELRGGFAAVDQTYLQVRSALAVALRENPAFDPYPIPQVGELIEQLRSTVP